MIEEFLEGLSTTASEQFGESLLANSVDTTKDWIYFERTDKNSTSQTRYFYKVFSYGGKMCANYYDFNIFDDKGTGYKKHLYSLEVDVNDIPKNISVSKTIKKKDWKKEVNNILKGAEPASPEHPYLVSKNIKPYTALQKGSDIYIPISKGSDLMGCQKITDEGEKRIYSSVQGTMMVVQKGGVNSKVFLTEGFSTACSIAESFPDSTVVATITAGNLKKVLVSLPDYNLDGLKVICGENVKNEKDVVKKMYDGLIDDGYIVIRPPKEYSDFNDLFVDKGKEAVIKLLDIDSPDVAGGFKLPVPLGYLNQNYYVYSTYVEDILKFDDVKKIKTFIGTSRVLMKHFPKEVRKDVTINFDLLNDILTDGCNKIGAYDPLGKYGFGMFKYGKDFVLNTGNTVYKFNTEEDKIINVSDDRASLSTKKKVFVRGGKNLDISGVDELSIDFFRDFVNHSKNLDISNLDSELLLGFLVSSVAGGVMPFRPHLWLSGNSSKGKSYIREDILMPFVDMQLKVAGTPTSAGVMQYMRYNAFPVLIDEVEPSKETTKKIKDIVALLREASVGLDNVRLRGTPSGEFLAFPVNYNAVVTGINPAITLEQDRNRWLEIAFPMESSGSFEECREYFDSLKDTPKLTDRMYKTVFSQCNNLLYNFELIKKAILKKHIINEHSAKKYAFCLSGFYTILKRNEISRVSVARLVDRFENIIEKDIAEKEESKSDYVNDFFCSEYKTTDSTKVNLFTAMFGVYKSFLKTQGMFVKKDFIYLLTTSKEVDKMFREVTDEKIQNWKNYLINVRGYKKKRMNNQYYIVIPTQEYDYLNLINKEDE